jgi:hypothetical protein
VATLYAACLSRLGLSQARAAELHGVRLDTVKNWSSGRRAVPPGAWDDLRDHARKLQKRVDDITAAQELPPLSDPLTLTAAAEVVLRAPSGTPVETRAGGSRGQQPG